MLSCGTFKHVIHVACLFSFIIAFQFNMGGLRFSVVEWDDSKSMENSYAVEKRIFLCLLNFVNLLNRLQSILITVGCDLFNCLIGDVRPNESFDTIRTVLLFMLRFTNLVGLLLFLFNFAGLLMCHPFPEKIELVKSPLQAPCICFRIVTKGDYPIMVRYNVKINMEICEKVGLENFCIEVVTDKPLNLPIVPRVREIVVPDAYRTKSNAMFKARALQYCLEDNVNLLGDDDWIVHLDEETLLTENAVCGILNFCTDGQHEFGQGVITYASGEIVNWMTTLVDSMRVADDMGRVRFQLRYFHRPLFGWKGSYVVARASAEHRVSFDHGPDGSITEDCCFAMMAFRDGYSFNFVEGEMLEKSPFTFWDFVRQRKRWVQGMILVAKKTDIPIRIKFLLCLSLYCWVAMPLSIAIVWVVAATGPFPPSWFFDSLVAFCSALNLYMGIFGAVKQFSNRHQKRPWILIFYSLGVLCLISYKIVAESISIIWAIFGEKKQFHVIRKTTTIEADGRSTAASSQHIDSSKSSLTVI